MQFFVEFCVTCECVLKYLNGDQHKLTTPGVKIQQMTEFITVMSLYMI